MSVRAITQVLEASQHAGTELLMLVVLADYSDDDGNSYPAVASLARKCRMTSRNANYILSTLQASGELRVLKNEGPKGTNRYRIMLAQMGRQALKQASPLKAASPPEAGFTPEAAFTLKPASATPEAGFPKPLKPTSDEPSLNRQEPSVAPSAAPTRLAPAIPSCPYDSIVALYHEALPTLPAVKTMEDGRKKAMAKRWKWIFTKAKTDGTLRAATEAEALRWMRSFFELANMNDFVMGRTPRSAGHENWRCGIDYLMTDRGLTEVIEKTEVATA